MFTVSFSSFCRWSRTPSIEMNEWNCKINSKHQHRVCEPSRVQNTTCCIATISRTLLHKGKLLSHFGPCNESLNLIFPTIYIYICNPPMLLKVGHKSWVRKQTDGHCAHSCFPYPGNQDTWFTVVSKMKDPSPITQFFNYRMVLECEMGACK